MRKKALSTLALFLATLSLQAADTLFVKETCQPVLIERKDNVWFYLRLDAKEQKQLESLNIEIDQSVKLSEIKALKLYYGGTEALQDSKKRTFCPIGAYIPTMAMGKTLEAHPSYSVKKDEETSPRKHQVVLEANQKLYPGVNYFWVSLEMKPKTSLHSLVKGKVSGAVADGQQLPIEYVSSKDIVMRMGKGIRHAGDDGAAAFRIPGLVTTNKGTLLGVYDVRYNSSVDLQEHINIGLSRSTDGGKSWEKMRLPLSFGEFDGLPSSQNGVGDPSILVDHKTNTIWVVAAWTHGMGNKRAWWSSHPGMDVKHTAQLVMAKSTDDGKTWSEPINITEQVKKPEWYFLLQGPGKGITMDDGTLVFPIQYIDQNRIPNAGIMYSKDSGKTWHIHNHARTNTTESQVAEVSPGVLMLNMRDNRGGSRAIYTTTDLGKTWTEHPSSRSALREPVCMASLIHVKAEDNVLKKDLLIFSNPNSQKDRNHITIKVSLDGGLTWKESNQLMLDEEYGWGYSCLSMIDKETVGILYESSVAHMTFQSIPLKDIVTEE